MMTISSWTNRIKWIVPAWLISSLLRSLWRHRKLPFDIPDVPEEEPEEIEEVEPYFNPVRDALIPISVDGSRHLVVPRDRIGMDHPDSTNYIPFKITTVALVPKALDLSDEKMCLHYQEWLTEVARAQ